MAKSMCTPNSHSNMCTPTSWRVWPRESLVTRERLPVHPSQFFPHNPEFTGEFLLFKNLPLITEFTVDWEKPDVFVVSLIGRLDFFPA